MGTIVARRRRDGSTGYTAQIRLRRGGEIVHTEAETFSSRALAVEWLRRREAELDKRRARGEPFGLRATVGELIAAHRADARHGPEWSRSKSADMRALEASAIARVRVDRLTAADVVAHIRARRDQGAGPATAGNDLVWLRSVLRARRVVDHVPASALDAVDAAAGELRRLQVIAKSRRRTRRLTPAEESALLEHFAQRDGRAQIPMRDIMRFALLTARRQAEITRLRWADLDRAAGVGWLDDVKHPRHKRGNRRCFRILRAAWDVIDSQPQTGPLVCPYDERSISAAWTRATRVLGIKDLRFHDLRHEATSRLFEAGYSIQEVALFTLHESWESLRSYTHLRPEEVPER
jgi:integrase